MCYSNSLRSYSPSRYCSIVILDELMRPFGYRLVYTFQGIFYILRAGPIQSRRQINRLLTRACGLALLGTTFSKLHRYHSSHLATRYGLSLLLQTVNMSQAHDDHSYRLGCRVLNRTHVLTKPIATKQKLPRNRLRYYKELYKLYRLAAKPWFFRTRPFRSRNSIYQRNRRV